MRKIWSKNSKHRSVVAPDRRLDEVISPDPDTVPDSAHPHVRTLARASHDLTSVKHLWLNGVMNATTANDVSDATLRLYRVDLRGSHLYVYRAPAQLNARLFKVTAAADDPFTASFSENTLSLNIGLQMAQTASGYPQSIISMDSAAPTAASTLAAPDPEPVAAITYFSQRVPYPGLQYDEELHTFLPGAPVEALVHFYLFAEDSHAPAVNQLRCVLPMLPKFGLVLTALHTLLVHIGKGDFGSIETESDTPGSVSLSSISIRVVDLLNHLAQSFSGYLLKYDVAPQVLKIIELLMASGSPRTLKLIAEFKNKMLAQQHELLSLLNSVDAASAGFNTQAPLKALTAATFLELTNILELASTISEIDAHFFTKWNANSDRSLLLYSSVADLPTGNMLFYTKNPLIFNNEFHIHYLARLLVHQLFLENPQATPRDRARILEKWIDLGCTLDKLGNMSSWLGISSIILSQPILRLASVWACVSPDYVKLLKNDWAPVLFELDRRHLTNNNTSQPAAHKDSDPAFSLKESFHIMVPRGLGKIYSKEKVIPYFGDLLINNTPTSSFSELENIWKKVNFSFERWDDYFNGLYNSDEIIQYNQDVLRRYDSMGFVFSNESLNQVLYLGVNKDTDKIIPDALKPEDSSAETTSKANPETYKTLLRLIDHNNESMNLETVMKYSLECEPCLPEAYLKLSEETILPKVHKLKIAANSSISVNSVESGASAADLADASDTLHALHKPMNEYILPEEKLPVFNNNNFMINLLKYDDLLLNPSDGDIDEKHNIVVDNDLTLRVDDFITEFDTSFSEPNSDNEDNTDDGLGINVDDILNSEKFNNFKISDNSEHPQAVMDRKHSSFGLVSVTSTANQSSNAVKYIPRFASMDKLIDLLLVDFKYFDANYQIDLTEYRFVFMLTYSSFLTTRELLEKLAHRFVHSGNAVISVMKKQHLMKTDKFDPLTFGNFPNWETDNLANLSELGDVNYELLLKIQINILKVLIVLINNFFANFFNDLKNKKIMIKLLKLYSNEILQWYNSTKISNELEKSFESLVHYYKRLKKTFLKKCYRPSELLKTDEFFSHELKIASSINEVPINRNLPGSKNIHKIEKFLSKFNKMLSVFYKGITPESWFQTYKILENLYQNYSLINFEMQKNTVSDENMTISNVFSYFETLFDLSRKDLVLGKLPLAFRILFKIYFKFRSYLLLQLCDSQITTDERLERMKTLILMLKISRLKMSESQFVFEGDQKEIPSCIETAITNTVYSPQSRYFSDLWVLASQSLHRSDAATASSNISIETLLPANVTHDDLLLPHETLLPCFGWIIENLIAINKCPSYHRTKINFNKRYLIFKIIRELSIEDTDESKDPANETKEFDFLLRLDDSIVPLVLDLKQSISQDHTNRYHFRSIIQSQHSILATESRKKAMRDIRTQTDPAPGPSQAQLSRKTSSNTLRRQSMNYKTNSTSRFKISGLFSKSRSFGVNSSGLERVVQFQELPDPATVIEVKLKPTAIIQLKDKKIFPVYSLSNCFKIDSDTGGGAFVFQAPTDADAKDWLNKVGYANKHWFYSRQISAKGNHDFTTFGIPLELVCSRTNSTSPDFLRQIYEAIEAEGLKDVGIYRISTSISELANLKNEIDTIGYIDMTLRAVDVHSLTSCVKLYFRELPDALLTNEVIELFNGLGQARQEGKSTVFDPQAYKDIVGKLPAMNYETFKLLLSHLNKVNAAKEHNKMTASNLATVIGPALTESSNLESIVTSFGMINYALERLIENYEAVFDGAGASM